MQVRDKSAGKLEIYNKPQLVSLGSIEELTNTKGSLSSDCSGGRAYVRYDPLYSDPNNPQNPGRPMDNKGFPQ